MNEREYEAAEREMDIYRKQIEELQRQNAVLVEALEATRETLLGTAGVLGMVIIKAGPRPSGRRWSMKEEWFWDYIKIDASPSFYRIWDEDNNTIAHFELPNNNFYDDTMEDICKRYNYLKSQERGVHG